MQERTRKNLIRVAWGLCLLSVGALIGLFSGRPLFYTDGSDQWFSGGLADAAMVEWGVPQPEFELPAGARGRVAPLPDGTFVVAMDLPDGTTDLVTWDPRRPALAPEPVFGINGPGHDLAPAWGPEDTLWFASDRAGGAGGFDLFTARWVEGGFLPPRRLEGPVNSPLDETDPAPAPGGDLLVFVRREPGADDGHNGVLWRWGAESTVAPVRLFPLESERARRRQPLDRDPAFSADGTNLWFVRKVGVRPAVVVRTWHRDGGFVRPVASAAFLGMSLRGPQPLGDGRRLRLVRPGDSPITFVSSAFDLYPWWPGQRHYELMALGMLAVSMLLLCLLYMGRRWHALDLISQCLFLSLFLHLLLLLWLAQMEIVQEFFEEGPAEGGFQVELVSGRPDSGGGSGELTQQLHDASRELRLEGRERTLAAVAPAAAMTGDPNTSPDGPQTVRPETTVARILEAVRAALGDQVEVAPSRTGRDARADPSARSVAVAEARATPLDAAKAAGAVESVTVIVPGTSVARSAGTGSAAAAQRTGSAPAPELPEPRGVSTATVAVADQPGLGPQHTGADTPRTVTARGAGTNARRPPVLTTERVLAVPSRGGGTPAPMTGPVLARQGSRPAASRAVGPEIPEPADSRADVDLRDAPAAALPLRRGDAAGAPATLAVSAIMAAEGPSAQAAQVERALRFGHGATARTTSALPASSLAAAPPPQLPAAQRPSARPRPDRATGRVALADRPQRAGGPVAPQTGGAEERARLLPGAALALRGAQPTTPPVARANRGAVGARSDGLPVPGSDLARAGARATGPRSRAPNRAVASRLRPGAALRDLGSAARKPRPREGTGRGLPAPRAASLEAVGPVTAALHRPGRPLDLDSGADARRAGIRAPGSLLTRAPRRTLAARPVVSLAATPYSNRFGPAKAKAIERFGGTAETERAVADGLAYLAGIQHEDGHWGRAGHHDGKYGRVHIGKTGLCLLAFLGAGHTPESRTEHSRVATRAVEYLLSVQHEGTGAFGRTSSYSHGIATYALAECYGLTKDEHLVEPIHRAIRWIVRNQDPRRERQNIGGWGYFSDSLRRDDSYPRTSITAWMVMALESARMSGLEVPEDTLNGARSFLLGAFDRRGFFRYNHSRSRLDSGWPTLPASTPAAAFALILLGVDVDDHRIRTAAEYTVDRRPSRYRRYNDDDFVLRGRGNVYFWYYGSLCCFLVGGDAWETWNERLRTVLPAGQAPDGSFPPIDVYSEYADEQADDRSYTTAMCVLSLEVYYRYFTPLLKGR